MNLTQTQLKDIIANCDADYYIIRKQYSMIDSVIREQGYFVEVAKIKRAVNSLVKNDIYFKRMAENLAS